MAIAVACMFGRLRACVHVRRVHACGAVAPVAPRWAVCLMTGLPRAVGCRAPLWWMGQPRLACARGAPRRGALWCGVHIGGLWQSFRSLLGGERAVPRLVVGGLPVLSLPEAQALSPPADVHSLPLVGAWRMWATSSVRRLRQRCSVGRVSVWSSVRFFLRISAASLRTQFFLYLPLDIMAALAAALAQRRWQRELEMADSRVPSLPWTPRPRGPEAGRFRSQLAHARRPQSAPPARVA